jgi:hypothetical protein
MASSGTARRSATGGAVLALAAALAAAPAVRADPGEVGAAEAKVLAAVRQLDSLLVAKDAAGLARLLSDGFVGAIPTGEAFGKAAYIAYHCRPDEGLTSVEIAPGTSPTVRVLDGRFAVVNRRAAVRRRAPDGREQAFAVQRIEVLALQDGAWRVLAGQGTAAGPLPPR